MTNNTFKTKERNLVIMLLSVGKQMTGYHKINSRTVEFEFDAGDVKDIVLRWNKGQPIPISDIREIFKAEDIFNTCIHNA